MKEKLIHDERHEKTYALIFDKGDEFMALLTEFARRHNFGGSHFTGIGALSDLVIGYFDRDKKDYKKIPIGEQVEVLSLIGDIAFKDDEPNVHAHIVVGKADGTAHGGHIVEAHVWPILELIITESPRHLQRFLDQETGLALIRV